MLQITRKKLGWLFTLLTCLSVILSCGGGGGGSDDNNGDDNGAPALVDLSGTWQVNETVDGNCDEDYPYTRILIYTGTQQGNTVTMTDTVENREIHATLNGYTLKSTYTVPDGDGTLTVSSTVTCSGDGQSFTGEGQWTYNETGYSCTGTTQVTGTKLNDAQVDATGTWNGTYTSHEYGVNGTFSIIITDTNGTLTGTIRVPLIGMSDAELTGSVDGSVITFGDISGQITFHGTVTGTGTASGTYQYPGINDEGAWDANRS